MSNNQRVSLDIHYEIEQFLYDEARTLDAYNIREWLDTMVDPDIRYQMTVREERFRKDRRQASTGELFLYDDNHVALNMRVKQFESGLQTMLDPLQRIRRAISNITAYHGETAGEFRVLSYGIASRFRRLYENEQVIYAREDLLRKDADGNFRIAHRRVELDERVTRNKGILFFL